MGAEPSRRRRPRTVFTVDKCGNLASHVDMPRARDLLGPRGPLSRALANYEDRPGQLAMAEAVERALAHDRVLACEAGTGTGKTLAYLVPAILSGKKVVVSTAT